MLLTLLLVSAFAGPARAVVPERALEYLRVVEDAEGVGSPGPWRRLVADGPAYWSEERREQVLVFVATAPASDDAYDDARRRAKLAEERCRCEVVLAGRGAGGGLAAYAAYTRGLRAYVFEPLMPDRAGFLRLLGCGEKKDCKGDEERIYAVLLRDGPAERQRKSAGGEFPGKSEVLDARRSPAGDASDLALFRAALLARAGEASKLRRVAGKHARTAGDKIEWVRLDGGSFMMGGGPGDEGPRHRVTVKGFSIAKSPVTNAQYAACVRAGACTPTEDCEPRSHEPDHPVVCVDWEQARAFSKWAGGRLPSEAEWEYAARSGGRDQRYPWGDEPPTCERVVMSGCDETTAPVCSRPAGDTAQGLCDMAGNVWQWTQDWYHSSYEGAPTDGSAWEKPEGAFRVFRGGSFLFDASYVRSTQRRCDVVPTRCGRVGFRPVRDL